MEFQTDPQDAATIVSGQQRSVIVPFDQAHMDVASLSFATIRAGRRTMDVVIEAVSFKPFGQIEDHDAFNMGMRGRAPSENGADPGARAMDVLADALQRRHGHMENDQMLTMVSFKYLGG